MKIKGVLYGITDRKLLEGRNFYGAIEEALKGGVDILQLREKEKSKDEIVEIGKRVLEITRFYNVPLIINDYPDVAKEVGADGVHLGKDDPSIEEARELLGKEAIIGVSAYGDLELARELERRGADYVAFGAVFRSPTKPDEEVIDLEVIRKAKKTLNIPVVAIGGINAENIETLIKRANPDIIAVVSAIFGQKNIKEATKRLKEMIIKCKREVESYGD